MLQVQQYLRDNSLDRLVEEFGIRATLHDSLPLVILNYHQIDSPKTHPISRECRALILRSDNFELVGRSFFRFFNWGEHQEEMKLFNWQDCSCSEKHDGSLVILYYFDGQWRANTRGSFAEDKIHGCDFTWQEGIKRALCVDHLAELDLDKNLTYICEFCSPLNKVVRQYNNFVMYLLTIFDGERELHYEEVNSFADHFALPERFCFNSAEAVKCHIEKVAENDPTFEGIVVCDKQNIRFKIKNAKYLALSQIKGNNEFHLKNLIPFILSGEKDEILTYFPEVKDIFEKYDNTVQSAYQALEEIWASSQGIDSQKDFALKIVGKTPFTGILFSLRKQYGLCYNLDKLKESWRQSGDMIVKHLF